MTSHQAHPTNQTKKQPLKKKPPGATNLTNYMINNPISGQHHLSKSPITKHGQSDRSPFQQELNFLTKNLGSPKHNLQDNQTPTGAKAIVGINPIQFPPHAPGGQNYKSNPNNVPGQQLGAKVQHQKTGSGPILNISNVTSPKNNTSPRTSQKGKGQTDQKHDSRKQKSFPHQL